MGVGLGTGVRKELWVQRGPARTSAALPRSLLLGRYRGAEAKVAQKGAHVLHDDAAHEKFVMWFIHIYLTLDFPLH